MKIPTKKQQRSYADVVRQPPVTQDPFLFNSQRVCFRLSDTVVIRRDVPHTYSGPYTIRSFPDCCKVSLALVAYPSLDVTTHIDNIVHAIRVQKQDITHPTTDVHQAISELLGLQSESRN